MNNFPPLPATAADCLRTLTRKDFQTDQEVRWCPGCGDSSILTQVQKVLAGRGIPPHQLAFVSGIGCSSRFPYYVNTYGFHGIHGRAPAIATGVKCANPDITVWVVTGDGDSLSIGTNHLIHCLRRNVDLKILLFNNRIYGLTKGQYSPTSEFGKKTKSSPAGTIEQPISPIHVALASQATFVARTLASTPAHMTKILEAAAKHKGAAFVEILQDCRVFNTGAFEGVSNRAQAEESQLLIEHGQPLLFGAGRRKGLAARNLEPVVVDVDPTAPAPEGVLVHNVEAHSPALAELLAALEPPEFPMAFGIFRQVTQPTYNDLLMEQVQQAVARRGRGSIEALLNSGTTWQVD